MPKQRLFEVVVKDCPHTLYALRRFYEEVGRAHARCSDVPVVEWQPYMFDASRADAIVRSHVIHERRITR